MDEEQSHSILNVWVELFVYALQRTDYEIYRQIVKDTLQIYLSVLLAYKKDREQLVSIYIRYTLMMGENTFPGTSVFFNVLIYGKMIDLGSYSSSKMLKEDKK